MTGGELAQALASRGLYVFPVKLPSKRPLVKWATEATADAEQIATWWAIDFPGAAVGVHAGKSGLVIVDVDEKGGKSGSAALTAAGLTLPRTLEYATPSGGRHYLYEAPDGIALTIAADTPVEGVDIRSGVGFAIFYGEPPHSRLKLAPAPPWAIVRGRGKKALAKPSTVEAWLAAVRGGKPKLEAVKVAKKVKLEGTTHKKMLATIADLVARGSSGERGIPGLLDGARARYVANYPESARHFDNALEGSVRHYGLPATTLPLPKPLKVPASAGAALLDKTERQLARFVKFPSDEALVAVVLWAAHTHLIERFDSTPRLAILSPEPASGKTRALEVLAKLVRDPVESVNASGAYLARRIGAGDRPPTLLLDEVDTLWGTRSRDAEAETQRGILNSGHRKGASYGRAAMRGKEVVTEEFSTFAPAALAGLGDLPDTIMSRSVIIRMRRRSQAEPVEPYRERSNGAELAALGGRLDAWATSVRKRIGNPWPTMPEGIVDRDADVWETLIAVADAAAGHWPDRARAAAVAMVTESHERPATLGIRLLGDVRRVLGDRKRIRSSELLHELMGIEESPWIDLGGRGPIDSRYLARTFAAYQVVGSHSIRFGGEGVARGWEAADFGDAFDRYLPADPTPLSSIDE